jgi:hypothetical protein
MPPRWAQTRSTKKPCTTGDEEGQTEEKGPRTHPRHTHDTHTRPRRGGVKGQQAAAAAAATPGSSRRRYGRVRLAAATRDLRVGNASRALAREPGRGSTDSRAWMTPLEAAMSACCTRTPLMDTARGSKEQAREEKEEAPPP